MYRHRCFPSKSMYRKIFIPTDKIKCFFSKGNFFSTDLQMGNIYGVFVLKMQYCKEIVKYLSVRVQDWYKNNLPGSSTRRNKSAQFLFLFFFNRVMQRKISIIEMVQRAAAKKVPLLQGYLLLQFSRQEVVALQIVCTYIRDVHIKKILLSC